MKNFGPCGLGLLIIALSSPARAQDVRVGLFPANGVVDVNPDTHLVLTFTAPPQVGTSGLIRIFDAADNTQADMLDMSIPAGPDFRRRRSATAPADTAVYQSNTIGGAEGFHFYPIIVRGNVATIYPHNHALKYGHKYLVKMDPAVLKPAAGTFAGFRTDTEWTFSTKSAPPLSGSARLVVSADGSGDFNTVQGAIDFIPTDHSQPITIFIKNGNYEEIVYFRAKSNLIIRGEDRDKVVVGYGNNSAFNPRIRPAFSFAAGIDVQLSNFTINNYYIGQAEALKVSGSRNIVDHMTLKGSGDALNLAGTVYLTDTTLTGDGDTILSVAAAFFNHCEIRSIGPVNWVRTPKTNRGHVFKDCTIVGLDQPLPWTVNPDGSGGQKTKSVLARLPNNGGTNYPYAEAVYINCRMDGVSPEGWGPIEDKATFDWSNVHFWEYNSMDKDGKPLDMSKRHPVTRILKQPEDTELIANYSKPEFVLGGWTPQVR